MMTGLKSASNYNHFNAQESFPVQFIRNNQSELCEENLFKANSKNFDEVNNRNELSSGINSIDPTPPETLSFDYEFSNPKNNPERLRPMQTFEDFGSLSNVSVKIYQPTSDYQKFMKSKHLCEKKIPRPKHFDFTFLQIRNFKYFCKDGNFKRIAKLKVIFSRKKLVYEFQVGETADSSGSNTKHLAIIEVDFHTIVAIWGQEDKFRLQVKVPPRMHMGTRFCKKNQNSSVQNVQYDRCHTTDLTCGELYRIPFHYIQLRSMSVNKLLACLSQFSPQFELMLRCPFIETFMKMLPQQRPETSDYIPGCYNEVLSSTCQNSQNQYVEFSENMSECSHHMDSSKSSCKMCSTMVKSFDDV
ncbi:Hypothetical predicted protein [Octopus vulgaris]|uniref:Uncharacterized protein n=1 Tax=Octopus vulgaris TaxID=6645 RepID=A0AA36BAU1_OCTVU|nr:Hypothetical predicted protein [Octopus vulgaris]